MSLKAVALFDCTADDPHTELTFHSNDLILQVSQAEEEGWFHGTLASSGRAGLFPGNYVRFITDEKENHDVSNPPISGSLKNDNGISGGASTTSGAQPSQNALALQGASHFISKNPPPIVRPGPRTTQVPPPQPLQSTSSPLPLNPKLTPAATNIPPASKIEINNATLPATATLITGNAIFPERQFIDLSLYPQSHPTPSCASSSATTSTLPLTSRTTLPTTTSPLTPPTKPRTTTNAKVDKFATRLELYEKSQSLVKSAAAKLATTSSTGATSGSHPNPNSIPNSTHASIETLALPARATTLSGPSLRAGTVSASPSRAATTTTSSTITTTQSPAKSTSIADRIQRLETLSSVSAPATVSVTKPSTKFIPVASKPFVPLIPALSDLPALSSTSSSTSHPTPQQQQLQSSLPAPSLSFQQQPQQQMQQPALPKRPPMMVSNASSTAPQPSFATSTLTTRTPAPPPAAAEISFPNLPSSNPTTTKTTKHPLPGIPLDAYTRYTSFFHSHLPSSASSSSSSTHLSQTPGLSPLNAPKNLLLLLPADTVRHVWLKSSLPPSTLSQIWTLVTTRQGGEVQQDAVMGLTEEAFVVGMAMIDDVLARAALSNVTKESGGGKGVVNDSSVPSPRLLPEWEAYLFGGT